MLALNKLCNSAFLHSYMREGSIVSEGLYVFFYSYKTEFLTSCELGLPQVLQ